MNVKEMGKAGLTGWRGRVGERVAGPVSEHTPFGRDQILAVIGAVFLALSIYSFVKTMRRVVQAGRGETVSA
ncbi:hypothetical protein BH20ACT24_BH20ACT24_21030 [soil metagenome]|nr:hypothetical protein [Actinomycetota bacterium]MBA3728094.1 hypothetical protein [Actinomycetota bacterium]